MGTQINIVEALSYPDSTRTLLSYSDIRENEIHVETYEENKEEFLLLQLSSLPSGLYYTYIKLVPYVHTK